MVRAGAGAKLGLLALTGSGGAKLRGPLHLAGWALGAGLGPHEGASHMTQLSWGLP